MIHGEPPLGVDDDLLDAYVFNVEMAPKWSEQWIPLLSVGFSIVSRSFNSMEAMINLAKNFKLVSGRLYRERT